MKKIAILRQRFSDPQAVAIFLATIRKKELTFGKEPRLMLLPLLFLGLSLALLLLFMK